MRTKCSSGGELLCLYCHNIQYIKWWNVEKPKLFYDYNVEINTALFSELTAEILAFKISFSASPLCKLHIFSSSNIHNSTCSLASLHIVRLKEKWFPLLVQTFLLMFLSTVTVLTCTLIIWLYQDDGNIKLLHLLCKQFNGVSSLKLKFTWE